MNEIIILCTIIVMETKPINKVDLYCTPAAAVVACKDLQYWLGQRAS